MPIITIGANYLVNPNESNNQNPKPSQVHQPGGNFQSRNQNTSGGSGSASQSPNSVNVGGITNQSGSSATNNNAGRSLRSWLGLGLAALLLLGGAWAGRGALASLFGTGDEPTIPTIQEVSSELDNLPLTATQDGSQLQINANALLGGYLQFQPTSLSQTESEAGQLYLNQHNQLIFFDGDQTYNLSQQPTTIDDAGGDLVTGQGLALNEGTLTNTGVLSLLGSGGIVVSGNGDLTLDLSDQVSLLGQSIENSELNNNSVTYTAGSGLSGGGQVALGQSANLDINPGSGLQITSDKVALGLLTSNWNQTGAFDVVLNNAGSELSILDASGQYLGTFDVKTLGQATTYNLPDPVAASDIVCLVNLGNCAGTGSGVTSTGGGDPNRIAKFTTSQNIENSSLLDDGSTVSIDDGVNLNIDSSSLYVDAASNLVGVGISSPSVALDVSGQGAFTGVVSGANAVNNNEFVTLGQLNDGTSTNAFVQGGNSFGALATLGTNDANDLVFETGDSERIRIDNGNGNVGIGQDVPTARLDVDTDDGENQVALVVDQGDITNNPTAVDIQNAGSGNSLQINTSDLVVQGGGNVGIGTTSPIEKLDVRGKIFSDGGYNFLHDSFGDRVQMGFFYNRSGLRFLRRSSEDGFVFRHDASGSRLVLQDVTSGSEGWEFLRAHRSQDYLSLNNDAVRIRSSGNVGIGTTSPSVALDVSGQGAFTGVVSGANAVNNNEFVTLGQLNDGTSTNAFVQGGNSFGALATLGTNDTQELAFETDSTERVRIDTNGNVGIGINPSTRLHLAANSSIRIGNDQLQISSGGASSTISNTNTTSGAAHLSLGAGTDSKVRINGNVGDGTGGLGIYSGGSSPTQQVQLGGSGSYYLNGGNIGIGTTSPSNLFSVSNNLTVDTNGRLYNGALAGAYSALDAGLAVTPRTSGAQAAVIRGLSSQTGDLLQIQNSSGTILSRFDASGNLGVGTDPSVALDVSGQGAFTGVVSGANAVNNNEFVTLGQLNDGTSTNAFVQGGNSFGATAVLGTNDANDLAFETNGTTRCSITSAGYFSCPGSGSVSEKFGLNASAAGGAATALGYSASADFSNGTAVGRSATVNDAFSTAVGSESSTTGSEATAIGYDSSSGGRWSVALGSKANAAGDGGIAIGQVSTATTGSISLGRVSNADLANIFVAGSTSAPINDVYFGRGRMASSPTSYTVHGTGGSGTDVAGANLLFAGGRGTGTGAGGDIIFQTAAASGSSGSSLNSLAERMRITQGGNVGIGTNSPSNRLRVYESGNNTNAVSAIHSSDFGLFVGTEATGTSRYALNVQSGLNAGGLGGGTSRLYVRADGNVGIGTDSPDRKLTVSGNGYSGYFYGGAPGIRFGDQDTFSGSTYQMTLGLATSTNNYANPSSAGDTILRAHTGKLLLGTSSNTTHLNIDTAGNVGVGTTSPSYKLDVQDGTGITGQFSGRVIGGDAVNNNEFVTLGQVSSGSTSTDAFLQGGNSFGTLATLGTNDANALVLETGGTERVRIDTSGSVGIGTTLPKGGLQVANDNLYLGDGDTLGYQRFARSDGGFQGFIGFTGGGFNEFEIRNQSGGENAIYLGNNRFNIKASDFLALHTASSERLRIDSSGNVGIGTTSPSSRLEILGAGTTAGTSSLNVANSSGSSALYVADNRQVGLSTTNPSASRVLTVAGATETVQNLYVTGVLGSSTNYLRMHNNNVDSYLDFSGGSLFVRDNGTPRLFIEDTTGNVGIRTTSPSELLHVNGNALVDGQLTVNGNSTFNGTFTVNGHIISGNSSGTTTAAAGAAACTSPTVSVSGNDTAGTITVTTGTSCSGGGVLATVTFANSYGAAPKVTLTPGNANAAGLDYFRGSTTADFTLETATTPTDSTTYTYDYQIIQ